MTALVQNGGGAVPEIASAQRFHPGQMVRLRDDVIQLHVAKYLSGGYLQEPFEDEGVLRQMRAGIAILTVEPLDQPIAVLDSASAEDCHHALRFRLPIAHNARAFGAWQFEVISSKVWSH